MTCNQKELGFDRLRWVDRYFLRSLALARRVPRSWPGTSYSEALFQVTAVAVLMPFTAVFSCVLITSFIWAPTFADAHPNFSPMITALVVGFLVIGIGNVWLRRRFRNFPPDAWADFDTDRDRRIVFWQKRIILVVCGVVIPVLAAIVTLGTLQ